MAIMPHRQPLPIELRALCQLLYSITDWSYKDVARRTGISRSTVSNWGYKDNWKAARLDLQKLRRRGSRSDEELVEEAKAAFDEVDTQARGGQAATKTHQLILETIEGGIAVIPEPPLPEDVREPPPPPPVDGVFDPPLPGAAAVGEDGDPPERSNARPPEPFEVEPRILDTADLVERYIQDAQEVNDRHFELYEAFHVLIRDRLGIQDDGTMEDPGPGLMPASEVKDLLQCVKAIQEGQRKALGIDKDDSKDTDIVLEYANLKTRHGDEATQIKVKGGTTRSEALEVATELLRQHGISLPPDVGSQAQVIDVEVDEIPSEIAKVVDAAFEEDSHDAQEGSEGSDAPVVATGDESPGESAPGRPGANERSRDSDLLSGR